MTEFKKFVEWADGSANAAELLDCTKYLVYKMMAGQRGMSKKTILKMHDLSPRRFPLRRLLEAA